MLADHPPVINGPPPPPPRRRKRREERRGVKCLNCFTPTTGRYCHECGQENVAVNISLWEIFREAVEEFVRFDSKLIRTLLPVIFKPGKLTREWSAGRRMTYLSPLKLYLTVTAIFFLLLPQIALRSDSSPDKDDFRIIGTSGNNAPVTKEDIQRDAKDVPAVIRYPVTQLMKLNALSDRNGKDTQRMLMQQLFEHVPTALFAMLPFYAAVLWVLYVRNRKFYVEHLVFALHCHAFYFVLLTVVVLVKMVSGGVPSTIANVVATFWIPIYSFAALKIAYGQGWFKTGFKWLALGFSYMFLLTLAVLASLVMAAADLPEPPSAAELKAANEVKTKDAKPPANPTPPAHKGDTGKD